MFASPYFHFQGSIFFSDWFPGAHEMPVEWPGDVSQGLDNCHLLPSGKVHNSS